jgi:multidrug efflux pump subunit AcrB
MSLPAQAIERKTLTNFLVFLILVAGVFSYFQLGRLEDPDFTIKTAVIVTQYPGASAEEVELEVTDRLEKAIQELPQLDNLYSLSRAGLSIIKVDIKESYWADRLPQVWDEMRRKINDISPQMPIRALPPEIMDDFSFVYGFVLAITGDGYSYAELEDYADFLQKDLSLVRGVARVELWGVQPKVIYLDISEAQVAALGLTIEDILLTLASQNAVVPAGHVEVPGRRLRLEVTGEFNSPDEIGRLQIRQSLADIAHNFVMQATEERRPMEASDELIRIEDIATVRMGYLEPPITRMRFNGQEALALSLANVAGGNVLATGAAVDKRLEELIAELPAGINVERFTWQSKEVKASIDAFVINLAEAILIVLIVIALSMGWRMGLVIGSALILTILATFVAMFLMGIELQRVSLGALVVALGMMVDNAIVVADGMVVRLGKGMNAREAAIESAEVPSWPLLGATFVAVLAFYPVYASTTGAGEYAQTLFLVVGLSLIISWVISVTVTPLQCIALIKPPAAGEEQADPYAGGMFRAFRSVLETALRQRALTLLAMVGLLVLALANVSRVPQQFFPDSTRSQFVIDYWAPEGTPIESVSEDLRSIEEKLAGDDRVKHFGSFIGAGGPRFYLPVDPEFPYASYAQIIVNTPTFSEVDPLVAELEPWLNDNVPQALTRVRKYTVGPGDTWQFEARITGPAEADLAILRRLGEEGMQILRQNPHAKHVRTDMREQVQKIVLSFNQEESRWTGVTRDNVAQSTLAGFDGLPVGLYRDGDDVLPIIARNTEEERQRAAANLDVTTVLPTLGVHAIPLSQIVDEITLQWEDPIIARWNRRRQIAVQGAPDGVTYPALRAEVIQQFEAMELPPGYAMEWDGEYKSTRDAQLSLLPGMPPTLAMILIIIVALFNSLRPALIMFLTIPFAVIGVIAVLAGTNTAFGFMALLGAMSLVGMMIKNAIVLLDEISLNRESGMEAYDATVMAAISRLRPVVLAALTTVLGVMPLLQDAFWTSMAMTIMAGLTFGTVLTMILVPVFYAMLYRIEAPQST